MRIKMLFVFAAICHVAGSTRADEVKIEYSEAATKAFGGKLPLSAEVTREDKMIGLRLANISDKHIVITKHEHSYGGHYEADDGTKLEEFGGVVPGTPTEFLDHVVLRPKSELGTHISFSSWDTWEIEVENKNATVYVFYSTFSGYFPTVGEYLSFTISGRVELKPNKGEQGGTGQPATRSESKPEGSDKPQPEAEGRSR